MLADAYPILTDPCLGLSSEYPWAMTFATLASLLAFTLEWILHKAFHRKLKVLHAPNGELRDPHDSAAGLPVSVKETSDTLPVTTPEQRMRLKALHNMVVSYTFEIGIIFHSKSLHCCSRCLYDCSAHASARQQDTEPSQDTVHTLCHVFAHTVLCSWYFLCPVLTCMILA